MLWLLLHLEGPDPISQLIEVYPWMSDITAIFFASQKALAEDQSSDVSSCLFAQVLHSCILGAHLVENRSSVHQLLGLRGG